MRVQITARHCDVPSDVLARTESQIQALTKYQPRATAADVVYSEEKVTRKVEVLVHIDGAEPVVAHGDGLEFRSALDEAVERLSRQLRRQRERRRDHQAPPLSDRISGE